MDDHVLFARSLAVVLEEYEEIEKFYTTQEVASAGKLIKEKQIDLVLIDINLGKAGERDGLSLAESLRKEFPELKLVILTGYDLPVYRQQAKKLGLQGFLNKNISPESLLDALQRIRQGQTCFPFDGSEPVLEALTDTEKRILTLLSSGRKRKEIAGELYISERTLSNHLQHIYEKLDVTSSVEAVTKAMKLGYICVEWR